MEALAGAVVDRHADHVGRQHIAGELDARIVQTEQPREQVRQRCLPDPGQIFDQQMSAREDACDGKPDLSLLAQDNPIRGVENVGERCCRCGLTEISQHQDSLGWRGSRLLLGRKELFRPQARALAAASRAGPIRVMYPMVIDREQFLQLKQVFEDGVADMERGEILHGAMFEVPSACL